MDAGPRRPASGLMETPRGHTPLGPDAPQYGFFQLVRLLLARRQGREMPGFGTNYRGEAVRMRPDPSHVFPASDVKRVDREDDPTGPAEVTLTFHGLYGIDSPLAFGFHERISSRPDSTEALREFLDIFSHRLYSLFWRAWARYRPELFEGEVPLRVVHDARLRALAGTGTPGSAEPPVDERVLLALSGRLSSWSRNAEGLRVLLETALDLGVSITENVPRRVELPLRPRVGQSRLGRDTVVGNRVLDASGHFRVEIGPLTMRQFLELLPGREGARLVDALVRLYAPDHLDYDIDLVLDSAEVPPMRLGEANSASLGLTACVGRPRKSHLHRTVRYAA